MLKGAEMASMRFREVAILKIAKALCFTLPKKQGSHLRVLNQRTAFPSAAGIGSSPFSEKGSPYTVGAKNLLQEIFWNIN